MEQSVMKVNRIQDIAERCLDMTPGVVRKFSLGRHLSSMERSSLPSVINGNMPAGIIVMVHYMGTTIKTRAQSRPTS